MKNFQDNSNELKKQIWDLIHEYSTPIENRERFIETDNLKLFFKKLLEIL